MTTTAIPSWGPDGLLPANYLKDPTSTFRSPYVVSLVDLVQRFSTSQERARVLDGFLRYRAALHGAGLTQGFQWLDGSFLERIELLENRPPNDLDLVTFFNFPTGAAAQQLLTGHPGLLPLDEQSQQALKSKYAVDAYIVNLGARPEQLIQQATYWYGMWSHRRSAQWKGFLQVDLASAEDAIARAQLTNLLPQQAQT